MRHRIAIILGIIATTGLTLGAYYARRADPAPAVATTEAVTRGSIVSQIAATGTLEAVQTVLVGSQVSGTILALNADFNGIVRKRRLVIARLDPSLFQTQVDSARANVTSAQADVQRAEVTLARHQHQARRGPGS